MEPDENRRLAKALGATRRVSNVPNPAPYTRVWKATCPACGYSFDLTLSPSATLPLVRHVDRYNHQLVWESDLPQEAQSG